jgi:hypothetical protein
MASVVVNGDTSGAVTLTAPAVAGTVTVTLPSTSGTMAVSGASQSFTDITATGNLTVNGNTTLGDASTDTILMTGAPSIGGAGLGMGMGFRNRIINGAMVIDQRNAGAAVTTSALQQLIFTLDRWGYYNDVVSKRTIQQSTVAPVGFNNSLLVTVISTDTVGPQQFIRQGIEGFNMADFGWGTANAKAVTLSFWVRSSVTGQMGGVIQNSVATRSYPFAYTISAANTWEQKTVAITGPTDGAWLTTNGAGLGIVFENGPGFNAQAAGSWANTNCSTSTGSVNLCATNGATWYVTGVQLEKGSTATAFDYRDFGRELILCQRYYWKWFPGNQNPAYVGGCSDGSSFFANFAHPVSMRAAPTFGTSNPSNSPSSSPVGNQFGVYVNGFKTCGTTFTAYTSVLISNIRVGTLTGVTAGQVMTFDTGNTFYFDWNAEL